MGIIQQQAIVAKVFDLFERMDTTELLYHNLCHTRWVVKWVSFLGEREQLNATEMELLELAAWMHDVGYLFDYRDHENCGANVAIEWMSEAGYATAQVQLVADAILSTQLDEQPNNLIECILNDADFSHFGAGGFVELSFKLRDEIGRKTQAKIDRREWMHQTIALMEAHCYHTGTARKSLALGKELNINLLSEKLSQIPVGPKKSVI